jgi:ferric-dicitrate binding protein FerR (iron transport regulator)
MSKLTDDFIALCVRRLSDEAFGDERIALEEFLKERECRDYYERLKARWDSAVETGGGPRVDTDRAFGELSARLGIQAPLPVAKNKIAAVVTPFPHVKFFRQLTAAVALVVVMGGVWWFATQRATTWDMHGIAWVKMRAVPGEKRGISLPDGSRVTLNAGSSLSYPRWKSGTRKVRLTGEAFFEVTHDPAFPFVVETDGMGITVLGTKFNVSAFPDETRRVVSLVEGRVRVEPTVTFAWQRGAPGTAITLEAGQQFCLDMATGKTTVGLFSTDAVTGWVHDRLVFDAEPLGMAAKKLERRFGVRVAFSDDTIKARIVNARFGQESLAEVLGMLSFACDLNYEITSDAGGVPQVRFSAAQYPDI